MVDVHSDLVANEEYDGVRILVDGVELLNERPAPDARHIQRLPGLSLTEGPHRIEAALVRGGTVVVDRRVDIRLTNDALLRMQLSRICRSVTCPNGADREATECENGVCVRPECTIATPDACPVVPACEASADCPMVTASCAVSVCEEGYCVTRDVTSGPGVCGPSEYCDPDLGCAPRASSTGDAGTGADAGPTCASGCDDGNPCTDDACVSGTCTSTPNTVACDDGAFCNGLDSCSGGTCSVHAGSVCGALTCDEAADVCRGCAATGCPSPMLGAWSACAYASDCATAGTRTREVLSFTCVADSCQAATTTETDGASCARPTDGASCGRGTWDETSMCRRRAECDSVWRQDVRHHDEVCRSGGCVDETHDELDLACYSESTEGSPCGSRAETPSYGSCDGADACATDGTQSVTITRPTCTGDVCRDVAIRTDVQACVRSTDGDLCAGPSDVATSGCNYPPSECAESASESFETRTTYCSGGTCSDVRVMGSGIRECDTRSTNGLDCGYFDCNQHYCSGGTCEPSGPPCP